MSATLAPDAPARRSLSQAMQVALLAGPFLSMVDSDIVNVALPAIAGQVHAALDTAQWVLSGYLLAAAAGLAASAYLAKRVGTLRVYLASLVGFTLASALCALAPTLGVLIAARVLQGALGAPLIPLAMTLLMGREGAGRGMPAAAGILLFLAPALGPTLGGALLRVTAWPAIFLINVPVGLIGALLVARALVGSPERGDPSVRVDPLGLALLAGGLVAAIYGATQGPLRGWGSLSSWPYLASGVVLLGTYALWARHRPHPAVDLTLLRHPQAALAVGLCALVSVVMFAMLVLIPLYMEDLQGLSPLVAGLALLPQGVVTGVGLGLGKRVAACWGTRLSALLGLAILAVGTAALLLLTATTPAWATATILCARGVAVGLTIRPLLDAMIAGLARGDRRRQYPVQRDAAPRRIHRHLVAGDVLRGAGTRARG